MQNLYSPTKLLSKNEFEKLEVAFQASWSEKTRNPDIKEQWTLENAAYGQCTPTALIVYDLYGGKIIYDKKNFHVWNELPDGTEVDFSRIQFKKPVIFHVYKYKTKDEILNSDHGKRTQMQERYELLKKRVLQSLE